MTTRMRVAPVAAFLEGTGLVTTVNGRPVAVFNVGGRFYAIDNTCPHRGGPLGEGELEGAVVTCPWHGWTWDVTTGTNTRNAAVTVACFPVTIEDGHVVVEIADAG